MKPFSDLPHRAIRQNVICLVGGILIACTMAVNSAPRTKVISTDLRHQRGVYVVGYSARAEVRAEFENQLVADLTARGMTAFASHLDIDDITRSSASEILRSAQLHAAAAVVVVREVFVDDGETDVGPDQRVTITHPDVEAFYQSTRASLGQSYDPNQEAFAQINAWLIDGQKSNHVWSGSTWSFKADGRGSAIAEVSTTVAEGVKSARAALLGPRLPNSAIQ